MYPENQDLLAISALRSLLLDEIDAANSGHPGMALDIAPALYTLFKNHLVADPGDPKWEKRDRFVLSSGHNSALLYALLHLAGYDLTIDDLKKFRQLGSRTPGHPEVDLVPGVDASGGPLGQGIAMAVGMAMAEEKLRASYPFGEDLLSHYTYCLCGDGCLEEGISQEAISLAGKLKLSKLILIYDRNGSTLDAPTSHTMTEDVKLRFFGAEWNVYEVKDGEDVAEIDKLIEKAKHSHSSPTLIIINTVIGKGTPKEGSHSTHGSPLSKEDLAKTKQALGYVHEPFEVLPEVYEAFAPFHERGKKAKEEYEQKLAEVQDKQTYEYKIYRDGIERNYEPYLANAIEFAPNAKAATRNINGKLLADMGSKMPFAFGGSADVAGSTKTPLDQDLIFSSANRQGNYIEYGIREFAMCAINNGILLHGGLYTYGGMFLVFADYCKAAMRLAALQHLPATYVLTHDSLAVGEDGPTHQPVEQLAMLRSIPNMTVIRPCDGRECYGAYLAAMNNKNGPTSLILSRQNLPVVTLSSAEKVRRGAYFIRNERKPDLLLIATGSEVALAVKASEILAKEGIKASVVSMPSMELFEKQSESYKKEILSVPYEKRVSIEMLSTFGWGKYAKYNIGVETFGESGKDYMVLEHFGFTGEKIAKKIKDFAILK